MEDIGSEISEKIRAAIKAKLVELGAYIDNELPDYVMIMVANKRTRQQMNDDLQLFLGRNTKIFTSWLKTVMQRLQEVTVPDFDMKKAGLKSKGVKRKRANSEDSAKKESKSAGKKNKTGKKRLKKVKDGKKLKKSKNRAKEKEKDKDSKERQGSTESAGNDDKEDKGQESSQVEQGDSPTDNNKDKVTGKDGQNLSDSSVPKVPEKVKDSCSENEEVEEAVEEGSSARSSSPSHYSNENVKDTVEDEPEEEEEEEGEEEEEEEEDEEVEEEEEEDEYEEEEEDDDDATVEGEKEEEMEDPLKENEYQSDEKSDDKPNSSKSESQSKQAEPTFKVPTRELLKQHDRMFREREGNYGKRRKKSETKPEDVPPPPPPPPRETPRRSTYAVTRSGLRKIVLHGKTITLPPDFDIFNLCSRTKVDPSLSALRAKRISHRRDHDVEEEYEDEDEDEELYSGRSPVNEGHSPKVKTESAVPSTSEPKSNIISISKSLEMEKNLGVKSDERKKKSENKKSVSSRICTIPEPEEPEISSVIKVKPREFMPKEKQANKALILKAVADAEKSVATAHTRNDNDIDSKKSEGLFTKNLRGKRFEKLAVTLSNVEAGGSIADRVKSKRVISVDSENTNAQDRKTESLKDSELSQGVKSIPDLTLKNISNKSEDQFISSKTSAMDKNDKYIHCWLEGVEKAVKDEEIVNPGDMDTYPVSFSGEEKENYIPSSSSEEFGEEEDYDEEEEMEEVEEGEEEEEVDETQELEEAETEEVEDEDSQSAQPLDEEQESYEEERSEEKISGSTKGNEDEDEVPEIVVTLDGLTSRTVKSIVLRKRDAPNGPLLGSSSKKTDGKDDDLDNKETEEKPVIRYKEVDSPDDAGTSKQSGSGCADKEVKFEKISDRFGRINNTSENHEFKEKYYEFERQRYEKKRQKYMGTDKEKHYEMLKEKYATVPESKNKKLIARLSEKFGKVDREFEDRKKKYSYEDIRNIQGYYRRPDEYTGMDAKYRKRNRNSKNQSKP